MNNIDVTVSGDGGIHARVLKHSVSPTGKQIVTFELEYPRFIHAELLTHSLLARNCASSRAVPLKVAAQQVYTNPAYPIHYGKNEPGMSASSQLEGNDLKTAKRLWNKGINQAVELAIEYDAIKAHKQFAARCLEPYQMMKTVLSGTEFANFFHLRGDSAAQPEFQELAHCIHQALKVSEPTHLEHGEFHVPYVETKRVDSVLKYYSSGTEITLNDALKLSASCCAQASYRKLDTSIEKSLVIYDKLVGMEKKHASPFEHQATPMGVCNPFNPNTWDEGITHVSKNGALWSGRFIGWIQHRQLIPDTSKW